MLRRVAAYGLFVAGILIVIFFKGYNGRLIPYPILCWISGFVLAAAGGLMIISMPLWKKRRERRKLSSEIDWLKTHGIALKINLSSCEIKEHFYVESSEKADGTGFPEGVSDMGKYTAVLKQLQNPYTASNRQEVHQSILVCTCTFNGQQKQFVSPVINKDKATLIFLLDSQKETVVYVDKTNADRYYFDVGFLHG